jgi:tripartite-type tricarboxylate transporter receptor subunit TctC
MHRLLGALAALAFAATSATAQSWPTRSVTLVVPLAAGGGSDVLARVFAPRLSEILGQAVVIENVGGAGGMIGAARVAKAEPDGYQIVLGTLGTHASSQSMYQKPLYNAANDFEPVSLIFDMPLVLTVRKDFPANNLQEFIAYTRANQDKMQFGSSGVAGTGHLACELLNSAIGVKVTHIPYRGGGPAMQDQVAGRIDYQCPLASVAAPMIESGQIKAIALMSKDRSPIFPALATMHEQGLTDFESSAWNGFFLPKGTPASIVEKLRQATIAAMDTPAVAQRFKDLGATMVPPEKRSTEYFKTFVGSEIAKWTTIVKAANIPQQ